MWICGYVLLVIPLLTVMEQLHITPPWSVMVKVSFIVYRLLMCALCRCAVMRNLGNVFENEHQRFSPPRPNSKTVNLENAVPV